MLATPAALLKIAETFGVRLRTDGFKLYASSLRAIPEDLVAVLRQHKPALIPWLKAQGQITEHPKGE